MKNKGQIINGNAERGKFDPTKSRVNLAVPDVKVLTDENEIMPSKDVKPGLLIPVLEAVGENSSASTFKLCVDGKKINQCCTKHPIGQVDLFDFHGVQLPVRLYISFLRRPSWLTTTMESSEPTSPSNFLELKDARLCTGSGNALFVTMTSSTKRILLKR